MFLPKLEQVERYKYTGEKRHIKGERQKRKENKINGKKEGEAGG